VGEIHINKGRVGEERGGKETDGCPLTSTLPLDLNLWHYQFAHHNYADVRKMIKEGMVTRLVLDSKQQPDFICEPCLVGKMHSNPFPSL
jgi:hypothetical protein